MRPQKQRSSLWMTQRYLLALLVIAVLAILAYVALTLVIDHQNSTGAVVNISGRQRMLSQRTTLLVQRMLLTADTEEFERSRSNLLKATDLIELSHNDLTLGNAQLGLPDTMSEQVQRMYFQGKSALDPRMRTFVTSLRKVLDTSFGELKTDNPAVQHILSTAPGPLLVSLDKVVWQYQHDGEEIIRNLKLMEIGVLGLTLLTLLLEVFLIFRPMVKQVANQMESLKQVSKNLNYEVTERDKTQIALQKSRNELEIRVEKRTADLTKEITERTLAEKNLIKAKSVAEIANRAKSDFLATISHEIRTPLNGIMGMTELLIEKRLTGKKQFYAEMIQISGKSLLRVINDVLDFSKIESGEINFEEEAIDLRETRQEFRGLFAELAKKKGLSFKTRIHNKVPKCVKGDRHRIHQILINLLSNALKFTKSGEINFRIEAKEQENITLICFVVEDTGIGINKSAQETLFQPFTQADSSTTRQYGGTGLGLTICKKLADLMNGHIRMESKEGKGSRFVLELPMEVLETTPKQSVPEKQKKITLSKKTRVLVVEDNIINQRLFQIMLKNMGIQVRVSNNGLEALNALKKEKFDAVLMDCHMPEMDGMEAIQIYRKSEQDNNLPRTPFVAVTANVMQHEEKLCLQAGFDRFMGKPVDKQEFQKVLHELVSDDKTSKK
jgi:signal transduction histidine kinase/ActR/RegA family two-component response regulator